MMNAEIIAVGSELLLGQITNTNAQFLSKQLSELGINVYYHTVVGDNAERLKEAINIAEARANIIIFTGGPGPTKDDLTKLLQEKYDIVDLNKIGLSSDNHDIYVDRIMFPLSDTMGRIVGFSISYWSCSCKNIEDISSELFHVPPLGSIFNVCFPRR